MDDTMKVILKKLDEIDSRLKGIENPSLATVSVTDKKVERDPLFAKALEIMDKLDEVSSKQLTEALKIDVKRAETIMDQMEAAGLGTCYTKEV